MPAQLYNNVTDTLSSPLGPSSTALSVTNGSKFTNPPAGDYFPLYVIASNGAHEIVHVTEVSGDTLTVERAQEGTDPLTFSGGETVQIRPTRQSLRELSILATSSTGTNQPIGEALDARVNFAQQKDNNAEFLYNTDYYGISPYRIPGQDYINILPGSGTVHRHFGGIARTNDGIIHLVHRKGLRHATSGEGAIVYCQVIEEGVEAQDEVVLSPSVSGKDKRDASIFATPRNRLIVHWCELNSDGSGPVTFYYIYSDDRGDSWTDPQVYDSTTFSFARSYGPVALFPYDNTFGYRLAKPSYKQIGSSDYITGIYYSDDDGATWAEGTPIKDETNPSADNETAALFLSSQVGIAVARGSGLNYSFTSDGGQTWSALVKPAWAVGSEKVSPSLNKVIVDGVQHALLAWTNRINDSVEFTWASIDELDATGEAFNNHRKSILDGLIQNAGGYQSFIIYNQNQLFGVVYKEFLNPDESSDVYLITIPAAQWIRDGRQRLQTWTPTIYGGTTPGTPVASVITGTYLKRPGWVEGTARIVLTSKGGAAGQVYIGGFPATVKSGVENRAALNIPFINNYNLTGYLTMSGQVFENTNTGRLWRQGTTGTDTLTFDQIDDDFNIYFTFGYPTDD